MTHETKLFAKEHYVFGTKESLASYHIPFEYLLVFLQKETNSKANISDITIEIAFFFFFFFFFSIQPIYTDTIPKQKVY